MCDNILIKAVVPSLIFLFRYRYSSGYMGGKFFDTPFSLTLFMLPPHSSQIMGCCMKIKSLKLYNPGPLHFVYCLSFCFCELVLYFVYMQVEWRGLLFYATWVWLGNLVLMSVCLRGDVGLLKCGVKWPRVTYIHQRRVRVLDFRRCGDGGRQSREVPLIQLACKKITRLVHTKNRNFHDKLKVSDPDYKVLPVKVQFRGIQG